MEVDDPFVKKVSNLVKSDGAIMIFVPDVLEDVVRRYVEGDRKALEGFVTGHYFIEKVDKFTLMNTNFHAHRLPFIISRLTAENFCLSDLVFSSTKPRYIQMVFERK